MIHLLGLSILVIARGVGILKRTRLFLPKQSLLTLYQLMIELYFRYCNIVLGQCNETLLDRLQTLENRVARVIANVSYEAADHSSLLCDYGWLNAHNLMLLDMYKTQKSLSSDGFYDPYHSVTEVHSYNTRSANKGNLQIPLTNLKELVIKLSLSLVLGYGIISQTVSNRHSHLMFSRENSRSI